MGCYSGGQRCNQDPHRVNVVCCFIVLSRPNSFSSAVLWKGMWKLCSAVSCIFHTNWYPILSLKGKVSSCIAHTFKHCKIRKHRNHTKCLYNLLPCMCKTLNGTITSLFPPAGTFTKSLPQPTCRVLMFNIQCVAQSPAYFVNHPNIALR